MRFNTGTWIVLGILIAGVALALVALSVRPPVPSMRRSATQPGEAPPRPSYTPFP